MWQHRFETGTDLSAQQIWPVIADIAGWADVDRNIAWIDVAGAPGEGTRFRLKPRGGPTLSFVVTAFAAPTTYADRCDMPGASMTTTHRLVPAADSGGTRIVVEIVVTGLLAWFWGPVAASKHASGLPAQTERILAHARQLAASAAPRVRSSSAAAASSAG